MSPKLNNFALRSSEIDSVAKRQQSSHATRKCLHTTSNCETVSFALEQHHTKDTQQIQ